MSGWTDRGGSWILTGPVGARGALHFTSARNAASHARWAARESGGILTVFDPNGKLYKVERMDPNDGIEIATILT